MGLFGKKQPKPVGCDMCGHVYTPGEGEGRPHIYTHIEKISLAGPTWLPPNLRTVAQGEYVFRCQRCNSFPSMKWPSEGGAFAAMNIHLGAKHNAGMFGNGRGFGMPQQFEMIPLG
jgi:hypothetical protein